MKVVLDTNIIISATFWEGTPFRIMEFIKDNKIELFISEEILKEYSEVINYPEIKDKIKDKYLEARTTFDELINISKLIVPTRKIDIVEEDPDDNAIIECAVEGNVNYIITKDNHLLKLKEFERIKIVLPEDFLKIFLGR